MSFKKKWALPRIAFIRRFPKTTKNIIARRAMKDQTNFERAKRSKFKMAQYAKKTGTLRSRMKLLKYQGQFRKRFGSPRAYR